MHTLALGSTILLERLKQVSAACRKQVESVEQLEQDGTFSKDEADAERVRIAAQKAAAKDEYKTSLQRIEKKYSDMNVTGGRTEDVGGMPGPCDRRVSDRGGGYGWCI